MISRYDDAARRVSEARRWLQYLTQCSRSLCSSQLLTRADARNGGHDGRYERQQLSDQQLERFWKQTSSGSGDEDTKEEEANGREGEKRERGRAGGEAIRRALEASARHLILTRHFARRRAALSSRS